MYLVRDNEIEEGLLHSFREHLRFCPECASHYDYLCKLLTVVRERCDRKTAPDGLKDRILASFEHRRSAVLE